MGTILTYGTEEQQIFKQWEDGPYRRSFEEGIVASGEDLDMGSVIGKITSSCPTTGTKADTNTGNGTVTAVTAGQKAEIGTYTLTCISAAAKDSSATMPTTGTAGGTNSGGTTMTAVTAGAKAIAGTYTITCTKAPDTPATPATTAALAGNTGNGTITAAPAVGATAKVGVHTFECNDAESNAGTFIHRDPDGNYVGIATVAEEYVGGGLTLTIADGDSDWIVGDAFTVTVASTGAGGEWEVKTPTGEVLADKAAVGTAYTSNQINFTINDAAGDAVVGDYFTVASVGNYGVFSVKTPTGLTLPDANVGVSYVNDHINFKINDGSTDFIVGDSFTIAVAAGSGKWVEIDFDAVDGSQNAHGILLKNIDTTDTTQKYIAFTGGGTYEILPGDKIVGATSEAYAYVVSVTLDSGSWAAGTAAGTLVIDNQSGTFESENLDVGDNSNVATIAGNSSAYYADTPAVAVVRDAVIDADYLSWPSGATDAEKAAALAQLTAKGILSDRDSA